jgi:hypothetical protein
MTMFDENGKRIDPKDVKKDADKKKDKKKK